MPKTTAVLDGDSSKLVDAINSAKKAMTGMDTSAKKLSDQLRDVADDADKAAGVFITKLGGPNAIKAAAGIGAAFVAAQSALSVFSGSMQAFAQTQGAAGQKAMADLDMAINELQGQLFTAVMGTDNLEDAMRTLIGIVGAAKDAFRLVLTPVRAFSEALRTLGTDHSGAAKLARANAEAEREYAKAVDASNISTQTAHQAYAGIQRDLIALLGTKKETAIFDLEQRQAEFHAVIEKQDAAIMERKLAAGDLAAKQAEATKREALIEAQTKKEREAIDRRNAYSQAAGARGTEEQLQGEARRNAEFAVLRDREANLQIEQAGQAAREAAAARIGVVEAGFGEERAKVIAAITKLEELKAKLQKGSAEASISNGGGVSGVKADSGLPTLEEVLKSREERLQAEEELIRIYGRRNEGMNHEQALREAQDNKKRIDEKQAYELNRLKETQKAEEEGRAARAKADADFDANQKIIDAAKEEAKKKEIADIEAVGKEYAQLAADQLASGEKASKVAEKMARKALGGQISALGDKAMAEAAILAAALNPLALPMAAAGVAAYTAAAALGSDAKKAASSTPAAAAPVQAAPVNTSFNLRVDAAFADGESIARQFAMMQQSAQRRGLVPRGAY